MAKYLAENGVSWTFWKTIGPIHFIPGGIYPYGVSLLTPIHFRVPSLILGPMVAKYLAENRVSGTFWKNYWFISLISYLSFTLMGWVSWHLSIHFRVPSLIFGPLVANYANPVYGVATVCHQVRWLCWGHLGLFHTARSLLIWYKMFCMRDISYKLIWMEFINMFSMYAQSGTHSRFDW